LLRGEPCAASKSAAALAARYAHTGAYFIAKLRASFRDEIDLALASLACAYESRDHGLCYLNGSFVA
jgi:hypothetical protein